MSERHATGTYGPHEDGPAVAHVRSRLPEEEASTRAALLASGFADPGRIRLLMALSGGPVCVGDLALALDVSQSSVSHQLRLLRSIGIVASSRRGRHIYYSLAWPATVGILSELLEAEADEHWQNPADAGVTIQETEETL